MRQVVGNLPPLHTILGCWVWMRPFPRDQSIPSETGENSQLSSLVGHYRRGPGRLDDIPSHFAVDPLPPQYCIHNCSQGAELLCSWFSFPTFLFFFLSLHLLEMIKIVSMRTDTSEVPWYLRAEDLPALWHYALVDQTLAVPCLTSCIGLAELGWRAQLKKMHP